MRISALEIKHDVFLSHNSADKAAVEVLGNRLRQDGLRVFLDKWNLVPGGAWQQELADALEQSACAAIFLGPAGQGPWHNEELQVALHRAVRTRNDYRVIPVLLPGAEPSQIDGFLELRTWVDFRPGLDDEVAYRRLVAGIKGEPPDDTSYELPDLPRPYRGLDRFEADHQEFFFGREEDTRRLVEKLRTSQFVAVIGASGSGKSSLVRAGLLPKLAGDAIPNSSQWRTLVVVPGDDPIRAIANQLARDVPRTDRTQIVSDLVHQIDGAEGGLRDTLTTWYADSPRPLLLVIDQFEEVFTHATAVGGAEKQPRFLAELTDAVNRPGQPLRVVITLRADFLDRALKFPDLKDLLQDRQYLLGELSVDALREAIVRPAQAVGAFFEKGLVNLILRDVAGQPGVLPLLQHALDELWRARRGPWLTVAAYEDSGGVRAALHRRAQETYEQLGSETQRGLARHILVRLAAFREGLVETRRRAQRDELYPAGVSREEVNTVIEALAGPAARLIRTDEDTVEVTHEALIQNWGTLRSWLEEDRQALRVHRRLTEAAQEWQREAKQDAHLYHADSARLAEAVEWSQTHGASMNLLEREFLDASVALRDRRRLEEEHQLQRLRHRAIVALVLALGVLVLGVVATVGLNVARTMSSRAAASRVETLLARLDATPAEFASWLSTVREDAAEAAFATPLLKEQYTRGHGMRKLRAAMALAQLGHPDLEFLVQQVEDLPAEEMANLQGSLAVDPERAEVLLGNLLNPRIDPRADKSTAPATGGASLKQRLRYTKVASTLIYLGRTARLVESLAPSEAPEHRTHFIADYRDWMGAPDRFVERFEQVIDPDLQATLCLAVAFAKDKFDTSQRKRMADRLSELAGSPQAAVHSSADYALATWEPKAGTHQRPPRDKQANWRQVSVRSASGSGPPQVITMLEIPAGILVRHDERNNHTRNELPIPKYWIADCELPVAVYALFLEDRPEMRTSPNSDPEQTWNQTEPAHPARKVCWLDAVEFCNWLSQRQGLTPCYESAGQDLWRCNFDADGFRLPTEAEWEYACRARATTRFCFGDAEEFASSYAWTIKNSRQDVQPVKQRLPNAWGLFDMHGNVAEWCWDKYWSYPDQSEIDRRVQAGLHPYQGVVPENTGPFRVARGGMSNDYEYDVTSSSRTRHEPTACESRIGFRVVQAWPRQPE